MKFRILILTLMIGWDFSLHLADLFKFWETYPLYPHFPLYGISYDIFWTAFWGIATLIGITLLFAKVNHTTVITHNHITTPKEESA